MVRSFRDLQVWKKAMTLTERIYVASESLPAAERYGLVSQLRRAAVSIPSNIAEGHALGGRSYLRHLQIALGSEAELQTQVELAIRLKLLSAPQAEGLVAQASEVGRMLRGLSNSLDIRNQEHPGS
jgi:four helix bundle protein